MGIDDFLIQLVKYWIRKNDLNSMDAIILRVAAFR